MAKQILDIIFCTAGLAFDGETVGKQSLGGSESAAYYMARAMAKRGHRVKHFTNTTVQSESDGVTYFPIQSWIGYSADAHHDVSIVQRNPNAVVHQINSKLSILWQHDLAVKRGADALRSSKWRLDKTFLLSQFHVDQYKAVVGYEDDELYLTRNGFDFAMQPAPKLWDQRDRNLFLYAARPERGLEHVLQTVFPRILERNPEAKLVLCTYDNAVKELAPFYQKIADLINALPKGSVQPLPGLKKADLYDLMTKCIAYIYPTPGPFSPEFAEISCIAAIEAQACGLPFIHTGVGALSETLPCKPGTVCDVQSMGDVAYELSQSPGLWTAVQRDQYEHVMRYDWDRIAGEWEERFYAWIAERNDSLPRLAQHFYRRSEIEGVRECIKRAEAVAPLDPILSHLRDEVETHYAFTENEATLAAHYKSMGREIIKDLETRRQMFTLDHIKTNPETRFSMMAQILQDHGVQSLFDAGCGHGWSSLYFANNLGLNVVGYDVDPGAIEWAKSIREQTNPQAKAFFFEEWSKAAYSVAKNHSGGMDAAICSEVLEHVVDPNAFIDRVETFVKPGGLVLCTVPFGPCEYDGPNWHGLGRTHIREFSQQCIYEMFSHKENFRCGAVRIANHSTLGDPLGFYIFSWQADGKPSRKRNIDRMIAHQRPVETVAVNIIAGPGSEKTIRWTLDSVKSVADEIIVGNTGMSPAALQACEDYGATVVWAPNPLEAGFSEARNEVLDKTSADWVLWIDTDERLIYPSTLRQYLRKNQANGYAVRQIHASIDESVQADTPVRLFRRDTGNRFRGLIHEHPEVEMNKGPGNVCILSGFPAIWHLGYETNQVRAGRFMRNRPLVERDREENPDRALGIFLDARDNILLMQEWAARAGGPNEQSIAYAKRALDLCNQYIEMKIPLMGIGVDNFRTDALRHLGVGFDATVDIRIARDNVGDPGPHGRRFADEADLKAFIERTIKDKMERISGPYW